VLFLPYPVMLARNVADGIKRYVESGGTAVAEARPAWNDERGFASEVIPGAGLSEVFGAREKLIRPVERPQLLVEASSRLPGLRPQETVPGEAFEEELEPLGKTRVLARFADGSAAMVENTYGKGKAILLGSFVGMAYQRHQNKSGKRLLLALASAAGIKLDIEVSGNASEVEVRRLVSGRVQLLFVFNHSPSMARTRVSLR